MGCQAGHSEPQSSAAPSPVSALEEPGPAAWGPRGCEGGSGGPSSDCSVPLPWHWLCQAFTLGGSLALTLASTSDTAPPSPIPAKLVPKLPGHGHHEGCGPPVPGVHPSGLRPGVESAFALQPHRLMGTVTVVRGDECSACKRV
ncbi:hypothetical protein E5288_WYG020049 [Bos mutus]|uniref:Uncharacterized protein n=1 Tax=Bos mutus TaxID=72004 RepID=A0A6B0S8T6_9CETA|nr:hypothetical protein [Bos mutus]